MSTRIAERRADTRADILTAARRLAVRDGIAALSLRDLAAEVGMRAPSLYTYFDSKSDIYDALFAAGYRELDERVEDVLSALSDDASLEEILTSAVETFIDFCLADVPRYQLMFTHAIPGWTPSEEAYAVSVGSFARMAERFAAQGLEDPALIDLYTAVVSGLAAQQIANDPAGTRWRDLVPEATRMFLDHARRKERTDA